MEYSITPIGFVKNIRKDMSDDFWGSVESEVEVVKEIPTEALDGIEAFSHLEIIFYFNQLKDEEVFMGARHPRGNPNWDRVGIFAQRAKIRPNKLGLTIVKLIKREGKKIFVSGLDAIDGTPIIDIKPVMKEFLPHEEVKQPEWSIELMKDYWK